ncbi:DUF58 domain-containing protein [Lentzea cavernae]|uniref:DUF58 domain-containing protein n=1 Tax=Lentzea cavernae TaxID=2020703 RepID=A0ABQ3MGJ5_9PSEU|nr:DUF58 domain-containing protein [Lentzea cavernae]GHH44092.1 hypothetical protein GCM10017774_43020 [Lentzea cavernae]
MRLTRRGVVVLLGSLLLAIGGHWAGYPLLRVLGAVGVGAVLGAVLVTARGPRVTVTRDVYPARVERGRPALATLRVRNTGSWRLRGFTAVDRAGENVRPVTVHALEPGAESTYHYELPTTTRGLMPVGPLTLHREDPFGLARNRVTAGETETLWVHPRVHAASARIGGYPRHHHEGSATDDALRGSLDLKEVREYQPGDEVRSMHWKATARTGRLMVRDSTDPVQPRFTLLLDTRASVSAALFEEAVDLAASLLSASALAGHRSRLVTSCGADVPTPGGAVAARQLLDRLCLQGQDSAGRELVPPALSVAGSRGGCLTVIAAGDADFGALAGLRARYSSRYLMVLGAHAAPVVPTARVIAAGEARTGVRLWNEVTR